MPIIQLICLANSKKNSGRCIAGVAISGDLTGQWVRPISELHDGRLELQHYSLGNQICPRIFDIIEIDLCAHKPKDYQPENWLISSDSSWKLVGRATKEQLNEHLKKKLSEASLNPELLKGREDRICYEDLQATPIDSSLTLIKPINILWNISTYEGKRKYRVKFMLSGQPYDLRITDPKWESLLQNVGDGIYESEQIVSIVKELNGFDPKKFMFTISLGVPFAPGSSDEMYCFKLVAAVIHSQFLES